MHPFQMYRSMGFDKCLHLYNQTQSRYITFSVTSVSSCCFSVTCPPAPPHSIPRRPALLLQIISGFRSMALFLCELDVWLLLLNTVLWGSPHVVAWISGLSNEQLSSDGSATVHPFTSGWMFRFIQHLPIVNTTERKTPG